MQKYAIVTIGYNRADCMMRLLNSLNEAHIEEEIPLIISLDNCGSDVVEKAVSAFEWKHGEKKVVLHPERLGLKKHVLSIGEWTKEYENIIVFEDDLFVSPYFFDYVKKCVDKYGEDDRIAGIGLYNNNLDQNSSYAFDAVNDGSDVYFMQYACSWGQVWTRSKWAKFMEWYEQNSAPFYDDPVVPPNVNRWNEKSWLKYHVKYCAQTERFFVFPQISLTTNFSSSGSHAKFDDNAYQNPLLWGEKEWNLPTLDQSHSKYNVYFENLGLASALGLPEDDFCADVYGQRKDSGGKRYWLTTRSADYKVLKSFGLDFRPREANVLANLGGEVIKLYDTHTPETYKGLTEKQVELVEMHYIVRATSLKKLIAYCKYVFFKRLNDRLKSKFKRKR